MTPAAGVRRPVSRPRIGRPAAALLTALLALHPAASAPLDQRRAELPARIEVRSEPLTGFDTRDPSRRRFGALEFRGGLELRSSLREFGGLSALRMSPDGLHFITVTDKGRWIRGGLVYRDRAPVGLVEVETAPVLGPDGKPIAERGWYDTEAIAEDGGTLYVGIERVNRILRFDYGKDGLLARGQPIAVPADVAKLPNNKGLEALAFVPKGLPLAGTLIAVSERGLDPAGNIRGFLIGGRSPGGFAVKRTDDYDISDATVLAEGSLLLLERKFSWTAGVAIRIRRVALSSVQPGALVDGPILLEADMGFQIDNMEGLAAHRTADGETVLTLVSDDNFSPLQRTILLQFTLLPAEPE